VIIDPIDENAHHCQLWGRRSVAQWKRVVVLLAMQVVSFILLLDQTMTHGGNAELPGTGISRWMWVI
jgi:hypothetical protein